MPDGRLLGRRHAYSQLEESAKRAPQSRRDILLQVPVGAAGLLIASGQQQDACAEDAAGLATGVVSEMCSGIFDTSCKRFYDPVTSLNPHRKANLLRPMNDRVVMCVGEVHNNKAHHSAELQLLSALRRKSSVNDPLTLGMEMFHSTHDHNKALEDYVFGDDSLADLLKRTNWRTTWGWPIENYAPMLQFAKANKIRVVGLNAPERVSVFVRDNGIDGLVGRPGFPEMDFKNSRHLTQFVKMFVPGEHGNLDMPYTVLPDGLRKRYEEQVLREEWIADSISKTANHYQGKFIAVVGRNHVEGRSGVPDRIERRLRGEDWARPFTVALRGGSDDPGFEPEMTPTAKDADWVWYLGQPA